MRHRIIVLALVLSMLPGCKDSGDRVLVSKFLYDSDITPPSRYDVVVFKYPKAPIENGTPKNYIKRLLGLPGELIAIFFGRLYCFHHTGSGVPEGITEEDWHKLTDTTGTNPLDIWEYPPKNTETAEKLWKLSQQDEKQGKKRRFEILRKPPRVMLALSRPVFDNDHQAKDLVGVIPERWAAQANAGWAADNTRGFKNSGAAKTEEWLRYRHLVRPLDWPEKGDKAKINEISERQHWPQLITDLMGYNTYNKVPGRDTLAYNWVGDLMLACKLTVDEPKGEFWMELSKGVDRFQARFDLATGICSLFRNSEHKTKAIVENGAPKTVLDWQLLASAETRVKAKGDYQIRFANYDERLTLWVGRDMPFEDGKVYPAAAQIGPDTVDMDPKAGLDGIKNNDLQPASLCSVGAAIQVHNLQLSRDTYYTGFTESGIVVCDHSADSHNLRIQGMDWGHPHAWGPLRELQPKTIYIYPGHYLCLGDNSPESSDSRAWGLVPERLMLGRALMVYFPFDRAGTIK